MQLVLLGPPGAGKGVQATLITQKYNIPHIATGDMLREEIKNNTHLGNKAKGYMESGSLVPDEIIIEMIEKRLTQPDTKDGFLFDGFPRTLTQAQSLDTLLKKLNMKLNYVINLKVTQDVIIKRLSTRRICKTCGAIFNIITMKPKIEGICDFCSSELYQRDDDKEEVIIERIKVYEKQTQPLIEYYTNKNILYNVNAAREKEDTFNDIVKIFNEYK